jgi:tetratricopeptide (TPR) repeat protein
MQTYIGELLAHAERRYFAGHLNEAIALLRDRAQASDFPSLSDSDQVALRLKLGELLVAAMFMDGEGAATAREHLHLAYMQADTRQRALVADLIGLSHYYEQLAREQPVFTTAQAQFETALQAREAWADSRELSQSHLHLGMVAQLTGDGEAAMDRFRRSYELAKKGGHKVEQSFAIRHIGFLHRGRGDFQAAYDAMTESLRLREEVGLIIYLPFSHITLADAALAIGRRDESERNYAAAQEVASRIGNKRAQLLSHLGLGRLHRARENWTAARIHFTTALTLGRQIGHEVASREADDALRSLPHVLD